MGKVFESIDERWRAFIEAQQMFFVATAPLGADGHVNVSPKGLDTFRVLGPLDVAYLDSTGSGAETIAHLRENGRIVIMFCTFEGAPKILRLHGRGEVLEPNDPGFRELREAFPTDVETRSIIRVRVERVSDSCGFGVPLYAFESHRTQLPAWADRKGDEGVRDYWAEKNGESIDGLPALRSVSPDAAE
ncbi:MAG: pyridoxamine 5'-phosphate oxidase family protein [Gemmatimonadota bacterium]